MQKWKNDPSLYNCPRKGNKKELEYYSTYKTEFLEADVLRDWESIERCKELWNYSMKLLNNPNIKEWSVLDCGTKDGQFPIWLSTKVKRSIGVEISDKYVQYAQNKNRPVIKGDVCNLQFDDNSFDATFSHHVLGLTPDYFKALEEMFRVLKPGGVLITLNDVPGNPKKHYCLINSPKEYIKWAKQFKNLNIIFGGRWKDNNEWIFLARKI